jgi:hypothetical protein
LLLGLLLLLLVLMMSNANKDPIYQLVATS